jgi:hypothetical protein
MGAKRLSVRPAYYIKEIAIADLELAQACEEINELRTGLSALQHKLENQLKSDAWLFSENRKLSNLVVLMNANHAAEIARLQRVHGLQIVQRDQRVAAADHERDEALSQLADAKRQLDEIYTPRIRDQERRDELDRYPGAGAG